MGQFSWRYSDTNKPMLDGIPHDSYLLVPDEFTDKYGRWIKESCYDGYGHFGPYDIYDLVLEWNRDYIPAVLCLIKKAKWQCLVHEKDIQNLEQYYQTGTAACPLRWLGILLACYDEDNARLMNPIKIVEAPIAYKFAAASESDPNQGWGDDCDDDDDDANDEY